MEPLEEGASASQLIADGAFVFSHIATRNDGMKECLRKARSASKTPVTVLITGETGTGKTGLAHAIHNASERKNGPCLIVNCSAIADTLLESELFGHEKGAFTGAENRKRGKFELADGGTLILDEIGDMSASAQAKVLRAVEYRRFERVGGEETLGVDVRLVAITNQNIPELIEGNAFRQDLYFRLREVSLAMPPLRERPEDLEWLVDLFLTECGQKFHKRLYGFGEEAMNVLRTYHWPGNVRELKAAVKHAAVLAGEEPIPPEDLPPEIRAAIPGAAAGDAGDLTLETMERRHIKRVLSLCDGDKKKSAGLLGIHYTTLLRKIEQYGQG
jgi:transcriptional regulator with PAS, ATPase and Fis domain